VAALDPTTGLRSDTGGVLTRPPGVAQRVQCSTASGRGSRGPAGTKTRRWRRLPGDDIQRRVPHRLALPARESGPRHTGIAAHFLSFWGLPRTQACVCRCPCHWGGPQCQKKKTCRTSGTLGPPQSASRRDTALVFRQPASVGHQLPSGTRDRRSVGREPPSVTRIQPPIATVLGIGCNVGSNVPRVHDSAPRSPALEQVVRVARELMGAAATLFGRVLCFVRNQ
jgi:hypothetical protein